MSNLRKIIAILLTVLTLMSVISAATPVLATEVTEITKTQSAEESSETGETVEEEQEEFVTSEEPEILDEMVEWRTESTKYFRNSDGSYTAAQYAYPIHYKENGEWKEIDNTLIEKNISGADKSFVAENTNTPAIFPEEFNKDSNNEISVTAGNHTIRFSPKKNQKGFKVSDGKIKGREELESVKIVKTAQEKQEFSSFKVTEKAEKPNIKEPKQKDRFKVENKSGAIVYEEVFKNVDFEYELNNSKLKESIVLNEKQTNYVFSFIMDLDGLFPVICQDGGINLCSDKAGKNPVSKIEAPYMVDSNGEYSNAVTMSIEENGEEYILTVTADENWLNDESRIYPVVIDPTINLNINRNNVIDNYVDDSEASESHPYAYHLYAGHSTLGKTRTYIKFKLPELPDDNCIITNATIVFNQQSVDKGSSDGYLTIHEVTDNWNNTDSSLLPTWNKQPEFDDKVLDYAKIELNEGNKVHNYQFDITKTVKEWYETDKLETNNGFMLKSLDESKVNRVQLFSAENSLEGAYPAIYVQFRNNKGIEGYWDYSSYGVGVVGTAHINDYSGNLVYELPLASSSGEIMPIDIVGYYNNYCAKQLVKDTPAKNVRTSIGRGFRLNYQQTVLPSTEYGLTGDNAETYPYVYTDADGTEHYIQKVVENEGEDNEKIIYKDEDGLGLTLTTALDENEKVYYKITDKAHNTYYFNFRGNLSRIKDNNGNEVKIIYKAADSNSNLLDRSRIDKIIDGAGHTYTFTYAKNSDNVELDYVRTIKDDADRVINFDISGGLLTKVKYPGGNVATFDYEISENDISEGRINAVYSNGIYELNFDYTSVKTGRRVKTVKEYGEGTEKGQVITFDRSKYNTTVMRSCGQDGIHYTENQSKGNDDIITTIQYDNMGRAISQQMKFGSGDEIGAGSCAYTTSDSDETASGFKNKVSGSGATGKYVENLLYDGNTEDDYDFWTYDKAGSVSAKRGTSTASKYIGTKSLKLTITEVTGEGGRCYYRQNFTSNVKSNTSYTLSAYVKVGDLEAFSDDALTGAFIQIIGYDSSGNAIESVNARSQIITERTNLNVNNGWRRLRCMVETGTNVEELRCYLFLRNATGSACFDGIQLEKGDTANDYNMLQNSHFTEFRNDSEPKFWSATGQLEFSTGSTITNGVKITSGTTGSNTKAMIITGSPGAEKGVAQTVEVDGNPDDTYILSAWAKGFPVNTTYHTELIKGKDTETTDDDEYSGTALFEIAVKVKYSASDGSDPEEFKTPATFNTTITDWQCASVPISLKYSKAKEGVTYTPQSIKIIPRYHNQENYAFFDKIMLVKDAASSYTYDDDGNILSASSNSEQESTMKYDDNNNLTSYKDTAGNETKLTYDENHNLQTQKSPKGVKTEYTYNDNGLLRTTEIHNNWLSIDSEKEGYVAPTAVIKTSQNYYTDVSGTSINEGAFIYATYDENKNKTSFTYDYNTGNILTVTNPKGVVKTNTYSGESTRPSTTTVNNSRVYYSYEDGTNRLESIKFGKYTNGKFDSNRFEKYYFKYDAFGNIINTAVGSQPLSINTFDERNGALLNTEYGNGDSRRFTYNNFGQRRLFYGTDEDSSNTSEKLLYSWVYNDSGINTAYVDRVNDIKLLYDYDSLGRLSKVETVDREENTFIGLTEYGYDVRNNLTNLITNYGGKTLEQQYFYSTVDENSNSASYAKDNLPTMYKLYGDRYAVYSYDSLNRLNQRKFKLKDDAALYYNYIYKSSDRNAEGESLYRTTQVSKEFIGNDVYIYSYDVLGNITSIKTAKRSTSSVNSTSFTNQKSYASYTYDDLGQLTEEKFLGDKTRKTWTYDELGNITERKEYVTEAITDPETNETTENERISKTVTYSYGKDDKSGWNNLLVAVDLDGSNDVDNNEIIEYDQIGNPTSYLGATLKWNGRQLTSYTDDDNTITYKYDADGLRASKTVTGVKSEYFYVNGQLHYEKRGNNKLYYFYDSNGYLSGIEYNGTTYYPATNRRGDVVAIYNSLGECVAKYEYDAWGNVLAVIDCDYYDKDTKETIEKDITNDITSTDIAMVNPIRYRGYYYDIETKLYYLQSRYYNPEVGRFLNADSLLPDIGGEVMGYNMFSYCLNNPVNMSDPTGHWPSWATVALGVAAAVVAVAVTVATLGAAAPAAACTLAAVGMSYGASYAVATTVATVAVAATTVVASAYAADVAYSSVTGDSVLLDTVFQGNTDAYETGMMLTSFATAGMFELAANSPGVCFVAGTLVSTLFGKTEIENIETGDKVWAKNPETGQKELKTVVRTFENESSELVHVFVNGEEIITTPTHPFYVPEKGWTDAIELRVGDILVLRNGNYVIIEKVQHEILETPIKVYNFEVEDFHTYYVSSSSILVHNADCGPLKGSNATSAAKKLGYQKTNYRSHGQSVYYNSKNKTYITPDIDGHNGGVWKMAKSVKDLSSKDTRMGTYDENLVLIGE